MREEQLTANNIELDSRKIAQSLYDEVTEVKSDLTDVKKDLREVLTLLKTKGLGGLEDAPGPEMKVTELVESMVCDYRLAR